MKQGRTLVELAAEITRQKETKTDFLAPTQEVEIIPAGATLNQDDGDPIEATAPLIKINGNGVYGITQHTHGQLAEYTDIPKKYYDRMMAQAPVLFARNVNHWLHKKPERRMVRTLDGNARAWLSDRYRVLDHDEVLESILPVIGELGDVTIESSEVTDRRLYLKCLFPKVQGEVTRGDVVQAGFVLSNSEIGAGAVSIQQLIFRLVCLNGMIRADAGLRKYHVGRLQGEGQDASLYFKSDTLLADDRAFLLKLRDIVRGAGDEVRFLESLKPLREAAGIKIEADPIEVVTKVQKKLTLTDTERTGVLTHLLSGGDLSKYGLANALTRTSQDVQDYDRATELEKIGGQVIDLAPTEWRTLAMAA